MRTGAAAGHVGCFHETGFYGSDREYLDLAVPYLEEGRQAGEPTYVACGPALQDLVRRAVPDLDGLRMTTAESHYVRPPAAIRAYREAFARDLAEGATQIRVLAEVPHPGTGAPWEGWRRYEAAANVVYDDFPVWGLCLYDRRSAPPEVLADVRRSHPMVATAGGGHEPCAEFADPLSLLAEHRCPPDPGAAPEVDLVDPRPADARRAVAGLLDGTGEDAADGLVLAVSEAVANAILHGSPPVRLRAWRDGAGVRVAVTDSGAGPASPLAGLVPEVAGTGGRGLWLVNQLVDEVHQRRDADGFTMVMALGA